MKALWLFAALLAPAAVENPRPAVVLAARGLRVLVLERDDQDPDAWTAIRDLGANVVAILRPPSPETNELAGASGLSYLAFLTTDEIALLSRDVARIEDIRSERNLAGFYFWDSQATEGFTTPESQQQAYSTLKLLFPDKLVLYPTRLDPIAWSPDYLDRYFRPQFTDLVTPYFYPVGTTVLGNAREEDAWPDRLGGLLSALAARVPPGKGLLPVLQGFEQEGYPVSSHFLADQFAVDRSFWPNLSNAIVFAWKIAAPGPLAEIAGRPDLQTGVCNFFRSVSRASGCRSKREVPWRAGG